MIPLKHILVPVRLEITLFGRQMRVARCHNNEASPWTDSITRLCGCVYCLRLGTLPCLAPITEGQDEINAKDNPSKPSKCISRLVADGACVDTQEDVSEEVEHYDEAVVTDLNEWPVNAVAFENPFVYSQEKDSPENQGCNEGHHADKLEEPVGCNTREALDTRLNADVSNQ